MPLRARERRVALGPSGVRALVQQGHRVWFETGAGAGAGFSDSDYQSAGATVVFGRMEALLRSEILACVHAPEPSEYELLQPGQTVVAFWALPTARPAEVAALQARGMTMPVRDCRPLADLPDARLYLNPACLPPR